MFLGKNMKNTFKLALGLATIFVASSSYALTLDTPYGKQDVPDNPQRIVVLDLGTADNLIQFQQTGRVVGIASSPYFPKYIQDAYKNVPSAGSLSKPDYEKIAELKPDLIVIAIRGFKNEEELRKIAPVYKSDIVYGKGYASIKQNALNLGKLVNNEATAKRLIADLDKRVAKVKNAAKNKSALVVLANDRKLSAFGPASRFSIVYEDFGFKPIDTNIKADRHGQEISYEYVKDKDPEYVFVVDRTAAISDVKDNAAQTFANPLLKNIKAARNNHVVGLDGQLWYLGFGGLKATDLMVTEFEKALHLKR